MFNSQSEMVFTSGAGDMVTKGAAVTSSGTTGWIDVVDAKEIILQLDANAGTGTAPSLSVSLLTSYNLSSATAVSVPNSAFTAVTTSPSMQILNVSSFHRYVQVTWTITGTTPSFVFGVYATAR